MSQKRYKSKLIKKALSQEGYLEKASNAFLDSKKANAGYNNYTKYGRDYGWNGVAWCCIFVWWCFKMAFGKTSEELFSKSASCEMSRQWFIKNGKYGSKPRVGSPIYFKVGTKPGANHTGIVYKHDKAHVYTCEGNTSPASGVVDNGGCVALKCYAINDTRILGYGYPDFDKKPLKAPDVVLHKGAEGSAVRKLQRCLNKVLKDDLEVDGIYGEGTATVVKHFKVTYKLESKDGDIYGKKMRKALNKALKEVQK